MADKTTRRAVFKSQEINILLEEVEANKSILFNRFKGSLTNQHKIKKWGEIAERITAVTGTTRSGVEVRKKWQDFISLTKKKSSEVRRQTTLTGAGVNTAPALTDEEERAMAIIGVSASQGIPGGVDIHAGITEEGHHSSEQRQEDEEPSSPLQSTSAAPTSLPVMTPLMAAPSTSAAATSRTLPDAPPRVTVPSTSATISAPSTASTATASNIGLSCQCSRDLVELEREKVSLLKDVCGLLREAAERDAHYQQEVIVLKRAKLDIVARQLALEEERFAQQNLSSLPEQQGNAYFLYVYRYLIWMLGKLNELRTLFHKAFCFSL